MYSVARECDNGKTSPKVPFEFWYFLFFSFLGPNIILQIIVHLIIFEFLASMFLVIANWYCKLGSKMKWIFLVNDGASHIHSNHQSYYKCVIFFNTIFLVFVNGVTLGVTIKEDRQVLTANTGCFLFFASLFLCFTYDYF